MSNFKVTHCAKSGGWIVIEVLSGLMSKKVSGPFTEKNQAEKRKEEFDLIESRRSDKEDSRSFLLKSLVENCDYAAPVKPGFSDSVVVPIKPNTDAAQTLRNIVDQIESGELPNEATVVCGTEVFHTGQVDDARAASDAVFNLNLGIHKLMNSALGGGE